MGYERTHYQMLGVDEGADESTLRRAYRRLAKRWHPDLCRTEGAAERFRRVDEAYRCLADPLARARYDQSLRWRRARSWLATSPPPDQAEGTWVRDVARRGPCRPAPAWHAPQAHADPRDRGIAKAVRWLLAVGALIALVAATWPDPVDSPGYGPSGEIVNPDQPVDAERGQPGRTQPPRRGRQSGYEGALSHPRSSSPMRPAGTSAGSRRPIPCPRGSAMCAAWLRTAAATAPGRLQWSQRPAGQPAARTRGAGLAP